MSVRVLRSFDDKDQGAGVNNQEFGGGGQQHLPVLQDRRGSFNSLMRNLYRQKQSLVLNGAPLEITEQFSSEYSDSWPAMTPESQGAATARRSTTPKPTTAAEVLSPYLPSGATSSPSDSGRGSFDVSADISRPSSSSPAVFNPLNISMPTPLRQHASVSMSLSSLVAAEQQWLRVTAELAAAASAMHAAACSRYPPAVYGSLTRGPALAATPPPPHPPPPPSVRMHCRHPAVGTSMSVAYLPPSYLPHGRRCFAHEHRPRDDAVHLWLGLSCHAPHRGVSCLRWERTSGHGIGCGCFFFVQYLWGKTRCSTSVSRWQRNKTARQIAHPTIFNAFQLAMGASLLLRFACNQRLLELPQNALLLHSPAEATRHNG